MAFSRTGVQNAYNHHVKIGNWSEDQHLHEAKMKEYLYKKSRGELMIQQVDTHVQEALTEVGLSFSRDGYVHIGDHVMLFSLETEGVVSCDPADKVQAGERGFACTTSTVTKTHVARNTFVIEAVQKDQDRVRVGDVLRYGQPFRLRCNPRLCKGEAFYLHSQPISSISSSKVTRKQEVCMSANGTTYDSVWKVMGQDIRTRFDKDSLPVEANTEVVILHAVTHQALSSAKLRYPNDFGIEFELSAHTYLDINKNRGLNAELLGKTTSDIPKRREGSSNTFAILTASAQDSERKLGRTPEEDQLLHESISRVMERVRDDVRRLGADRLYEMVRAFQANDTQRADVLSYATFRSVLIQFGVATAFRPEEWEVLCSGLDPAKDGCVEYPMFLSIVRGELGPLRTRIIQQIFDKLDRRGNDVIALDELRKFATSTALPKVLARWAGLSVVTKHTFFEWYACVSAFIQSDEYFHKLITEEWHVRV